MSTGGSERHVRPTQAHLHGQEVLPVPGGDVGQVAEPLLVSQRHREIEAAAVDAGAYVRGRIHGHAFRDGRSLVAGR